MAWSVGSAVSTGTVLTASRYNQDVIENLSVIGGAWTSYTPTWTNLTVGNATQASTYVKAGRLVIVRVDLTFGSTTSISGIPEFTLPANAVSAYTNNSALFGSAVVLDSDTGTAYPAFLLGKTGAAGTARVFISGANLTYTSFVAPSATVPMTWATGDRILGTFTYEAAS